MKKFKKKYLFLLSLPIVICASVISVTLAHRQEGIKQEFVVDLSEKNYRKVYLLDDNKFLIPLSVNVVSKDYLVDEIYTIVSDLRDLKVEGFTTVLPSDVKINRIELENGILNIDFSKEFLNYQSDLEEKIIEALTWSVLDFKEVNGLTISVDGVKLERMPNNGLVLPEVLNKEIGINKYHDLDRDNLNSDDVVLLYEKRIGEVNYYVPVTRKVVKEVCTTKTIMNSLDTSIALFSGLKSIDKFKEINSENVDCNNDSAVSVNLSKSSLIDDNLVDGDLYEVLMVTFMYNNLDARVSFIVDEESVSVSGYIDNESERVNNIIFNQVAI